MILIDNRQNKIEVTEETRKSVEDIIVHTLKEENINIDFEISIIFIDNDEIRSLNNQYRNIDKSTDVLSFPMLEYPKHQVFKEVYSKFDFDDSYKDEGRLVLGDMALSLEKAFDQSKEYEHSFLREVCYLTVHSVLHLLGYDHIEEEDKKVMRSREEEILSQFNLKR